MIWGICRAINRISTCNTRISVDILLIFLLTVMTSRYCKRCFRYVPKDLSGNKQNIHSSYSDILLIFLLTVMTRHVDI